MDRIYKPTSTPSHHYTLVRSPVQRKHRESRMKSSAFALASLAFALGLASTLATGYGGYGKNYVGSGTYGYDSKSYGNSEYDSYGYGYDSTGYDSYGYGQGYENSGYGNSGYGNSGYGSSGYGNSGYGHGYGRGKSRQQVTTIRYPVPVPFPQPMVAPALYQGSADTGLFGGIGASELALGLPLILLLLSNRSG